MISSIVVALLLVFGARAQKLVPKHGPCPTHKPVSDFVTQDLEGTWYIQYSQNPQELTHNCDIHIVAYLQATQYYKIIVRYKNQSRTEHVETKAVPIPDRDATIDVYIQKPNGEWTTVPWTYTMIGKIEKKGKTMAYLEYACQEVQGQHYEYYQIMSLSKKLSDRDYQTLKKIAKNKGNNEKFVKLNHEHC